MNVLLLAAGEGTRLRPHTYILPKPAIPFLNAPLISYSLSFLEDLPIQRLVVNTYHLPDKIKAVVQRIPHRAEQLFFSDEVGQILGSGGGFVKALPHFDLSKPIVMMNADEVVLPSESDTMKKAISIANKSDAIATLITMPHPDAGSKFGAVWCDTENRVLGFGKQEVPGAVKKLHYVGVAILSAKVAEFLPASKESNILYDGLVKAIAKGHQVKAHEISCKWFETGNQQDFLHATSECVQILKEKSEPYFSYLKKVMNRFASNTQITRHENYTLVADLSAKQDSHKFSGFVVLAERCHIKKGSVVENSVLGSGVQSSANSEIRNQLWLRQDGS